MMDDFGFTAVTEKYLKAEFKPVDPPLPPVDTRADRMMTAISGLLNNLRKSPENAYIHWPNRVEKIDEFEAKLKSILKDK